MKKVIKVADGGFVSLFCSFGEALDAVSTGQFLDDVLREFFEGFIRFLQCVFLEKIKSEPPFWVLVLILQSRTRHLFEDVSSGLSC